jgi:gluconokinase
MLTLLQYHPPANIAKMRAGIPLEDADRWDWLVSLREAAVTALEPDAESGGVVMTCSALKQKYRDVIRIAGIHERRVRIHFLCLQVDRDTLRSRLGGRNGHYMPSTMADSQLRDLEPIGKREADIVTIDVSGSWQENEVLAAATVSSLLKGKGVVRRSR